MKRKTLAAPHITDEVETNFLADSFGIFTVCVDRMQSADVASPLHLDASLQHQEFPMKALRKSDCPTFLPVPHILTDSETELLRQNTLLRNHVALLVSTNVDLLRQIEDLSSRNQLKQCHCMTGRALAS